MWLRKLIPSKEDSCSGCEEGLDIKSRRIRSCRMMSERGYKGLSFETSSTRSLNPEHRSLLCIAFWSFLQRKQMPPSIMALKRSACRPWKPKFRNVS